MNFKIKAITTTTKEGMSDTISKVHAWKPYFLLFQNIHFWSIFLSKNNNACLIHCHIERAKRGGALMISNIIQKAILMFWFMVVVREILFSTILLNPIFAVVVLLWFQNSQTHTEWCVQNMGVWCKFFSKLNSIKNY